VRNRDKGQRIESDPPVETSDMKLSHRDNNGQSHIPRLLVAGSKREFDHLKTVLSILWLHDDNMGYPKLGDMAMLVESSDYHAFPQSHSISY
jgi:hypothetical protein